jgi:hypothetical protein
MAHVMSSPYKLLHLFPELIEGAQRLAQAIHGYTGQYHLFACGQMSLSLDYLPLLPSFVCRLCH